MIAISSARPSSAHRLSLAGLVLACSLAAVQAGAQTAGPTVAATAPVSAPDADWRTVAPENLLVIDTTKGRILVELEPRMAPNHVVRVRALADRGFYDGLKWHRVIPNFMAQTGDPLGTGAGGSDLPDVAGEFNARRGRFADFALVANAGTGTRGILGSLPVQTQPDAQMFVTADMKVDASSLFCPGVAGMARSNDPNSANSQFFLMTGANPSLNGGYTSFGRVLAGLDVVKALKAGSEADNGAVADGADTMTHVRTADALPEGQRPSVRTLNPNSPVFTQRIAALREQRGLNFSICDVEIPTQVTGG